MRRRRNLWGKPCDPRRQLYRCLTPLLLAALFGAGLWLGWRQPLPQPAPAARIGAETLLLLPRTEQAADVPRVLVYTTHSSEGYAGEQRRAGVAGGVTVAAQSLCDALNELGVAAIYCPTLHDTDWNNAYTASLNSLLEYRQQYPSLEVFIDVHRDAALAGYTTVLANKSGAYAKMMLVVGTNASLEHPAWRENKAFADSVAASLERLLPGILRDVRTQSGRYNQHISTRALLVEIGSTENDVAQAQASARLLAQAVADSLAD
ncbi:MAG: stage II sporulation protein P [Bacillota bacterium]|nr:stage II sporulation protein P [Bacillota bacterium]